MVTKKTETRANKLKSIALGTRARTNKDVKKDESETTSKRPLPKRNMRTTKNKAKI